MGILLHDPCSGVSYNYQFDMHLDSIKGVAITDIPILTSECVLPHVERLD